MSIELLDAPKTAVAQYVPFYAQLAELEDSNSKLTFDYESKKGNKEARSHVNTLRLTKGALERTRKEAKEDSLKIGRAIDSEAKEICVRIEAMITVHQQALDAIEKRDADRITAIQNRIGAIECAVPMLEMIGSEDLAAGIAELELVAIDDTFAEFAAVAAKAKDACLIRLRDHLVIVKAQEAEAAELARLRAEAAARAQKDHDDAIAKAAEERTKAAAEAQAKQSAEAAAQAIAAAENKAKAEREAGERRELELKLQAENAERRRVEQENAAAQEKIDAAARAERQAAEAVQREQERVAAAARAEAAELAKREASKAHKTKINRAALAALVEGGMTEECAKQCVTLIASGKVPAISINY